MFRRTPFARMLLCTAVAFAVLPALAAPKKGGVPKHAPKRASREQILDLEQQWRNATLTGDVGTLDKLLSDDYVGISWTGQVNTKASQLARLRERTLVITKMDLTDMKVKLVDPIAIVTCRADLEGTNEGGPMKGAYLYTRVYQRLPNGDWQITNFESTRVPPLGHGGRPPRPPQPETTK